MKKLANPRSSEVCDFRQVRIYFLSDALEAVDDIRSFLQ